jgi:hypothetical protein
MKGLASRQNAWGWKTFDAHGARAVLYVGGYVDDRRHGQGFVKRADGTTYFGDFKFGLLWGFQIWPTLGISNLACAMVRES